MALFKSLFHLFSARTSQTEAYISGFSYEFTLNIAHMQFSTVKLFFERFLSL